VLEKIAKLLYKAERTDNDHERDALMAMAEKLMLRHGIDEAMARAAGGQEVKPEEIVKKRYNVASKTYGGSEISLRFHVALGLGLNGYKLGNNEAFIVVGHQSDVDRYDSLCNSVHLQAVSAMKRWWKANRENFYWSSSFEQLQSRGEFIKAFGRAVMERLQAERTEVVEEVPGSALVLRNREQELDQFMDTLGLRKGSNRSRTYSGGRDGYAAGRKATLDNKGIGGTKGAIR
jgi:predicted transcriptional regulator